MSRTVYISGAISGIKDYMARFAAAEEMLQSAGLRTVNPARLLKEYYEEYGYDKTMERCIEMLEDCEAIYMMKGWEHSRGANMEWQYATSNGLKIFYEEGLPREPPITKKILMDDLKAMGGCFTDKCHDRDFGGAFHTYKKAMTLYVWGRDRHLLEDADGAELFGNKAYKKPEEDETEGLFAAKFVSKCEQENREKQTNAAKEQVRNLLERMKRMV